jgi:hypothetical protein
VNARKAFDLSGRRWPHHPIRLEWPLSQADEKHAARLQQSGHLAKGTHTSKRRHVHPDGAEKGHVESEAEPMHNIQIRQAIINPADAWLGVAALRLASHSWRRLGGHDVMDPKL